MHADSNDADGVDIYGLSAFPYEGQWVGLPQIQNVDGAIVYLTYTDIDQDGFAGGGLYNLRIDPLLIPIGMLVDYYLSHIAAGQDSDSPCIDAGNGTAASHGLNERTTRTDSVFDTGMADLGFHYEVID